jgi:hypothetical protein
MAKFKIQKAATVNQFFDAGNVIGGTGGLTTISGTQIRPNVYVSGASSAGFGSILNQKGRAKFLVQDGSGNRGQCTLVNVPNANLTSTQMSIGVDTAVITYANVSNGGISSNSTYAYVIYQTANVSGPKAPGAGDYLRGTGLNGNVVVNTVTANTTTGQSNANVSLGQTQTVANTNSVASIYSGGFAARLTNKFVQDFSGLEYQWTFNNPTSTTVRIPGA